MIEDSPEDAVAEHGGLQLHLSQTSSSGYKGVVELSRGRGGARVSFKAQVRYQTTIRPIISAAPR